MYCAELLQIRGRGRAGGCVPVELRVGVGGVALVVWAEATVGTSKHTQCLYLYPGE
jgi:hypothetical protein